MYAVKEVWFEGRERAEFIYSHVYDTREEARDKALQYMKSDAATVRALEEDPRDDVRLRDMHSNAYQVVALTHDSVIGRQILGFKEIEDVRR